MKNEEAIKLLRRLEEDFLTLWESTRQDVMLQEILAVRHAIDFLLERTWPLLCRDPNYCGKDVYQCGCKSEEYFAQIIDPCQMNDPEKLMEVIRQRILIALQETNLDQSWGFIYRTIEGLISYKNNEKIRKNLDRSMFYEAREHVGELTKKLEIAQTALAKIAEKPENNVWYDEYYNEIDERDFVIKEMISTAKKALKDI